MQRSAASLRLRRATAPCRCVGAWVLLCGGSCRAHTMPAGWAGRAPQQHPTLACCLQGALSLLGPIMWGWLAVDLAYKAIGTDYARVIRAVFILAQVRGGGSVPGGAAPRLQCGSARATPAARWPPVGVARGDTRLHQPSA